MVHCKSRLLVECRSCSPFRGRRLNACALLPKHLHLCMRFKGSDGQRSGEHSVQGAQFGGGRPGVYTSWQEAFSCSRGHRSVWESCSDASSLHLKYGKKGGIGEGSFFSTTLKQFQFCGYCVHHKLGIVPSTKYAVWHITIVFYLFSFGRTVYHWLSCCPNPCNDSLLENIEFMLSFR